MPPQTIRVPRTDPGASVRATRLPRTQVGSFGERSAQGQFNVGKGIADFGKFIGEVGQRIQRKEDAAHRARDFEFFRAKIADAFTEEANKGSNFESRIAITDFNRFVNDTIDETLENHQGSAESRDILALALQKERITFSDSAAVRGAQSRQKAIDGALNNRFSKLAVMASDSPQATEGLIADVDSAVDLVADSLTPDQEQSYRKAGKEQIVLSSLDTFFALGQMDEAKEVLDKAAGLLSPEAQRKARNRIIVFETAGAKRQAELDANKKFLQKNGVKLTDEITQRLLGLDPIENKPTLSEQVAEIEKLTGTPMAREEILELEKAHVKKEGPLNLTPGRSRGLLAEMAFDFAEAETTPEDDLLFFSAIEGARTRDDRGNQANLPAFVLDALHRRGMTLHDVNTRLRQSRLSGGQPVRSLLEPETTQGQIGAEVSSTAPADTSNASSTVPESKQSDTLAAPAASRNAGDGSPIDPTGQLNATTAQLGAVVDETRDLEANGGMLAPEAQEPAITLFDSADKLTGPISGLKQQLSGTAFIGRLLPAPEIRQARRFMETFKQDFVRVLQNNPRFPVREREAILESLDLESKFFQEPESFKQDLIGLDEFLQLRQENLESTIQGGKVIGDELDHSINVLNALGKARKVLGVPQKFTSLADVQTAVANGQLRSGDKFRTPNGSIFRVP